MNKIVELFGHSASKTENAPWKQIVKRQKCPYLGKKCIKVRKSQPAISIGTCVVNYGSENKPVLICPFRLLERRQIFVDALHLLNIHEPGNELHIVPEVSIPGGSVDYFLVSAAKGKAVDFVGVELQTLDTTGTVWPERERFLDSVGLPVDKKAMKSAKPFGMNWKMTAKTILVQLHHKVDTFEHLSKHIVLAVQDCLLEYMRKEFSFSHMNSPRTGDTMHFHSYTLENNSKIHLSERCSTDAAGIAAALGLKAEANIELEKILSDIQKKISEKTLWTP